MTHENIEIMQRALGILEGVAFCAGERVCDAIACAVNMIDEVLEREMETDEKKNTF